MSKQIVTLYVIMVLCTLNLKAQNLIAVTQNGVSHFYTSLDSAITNANVGDTLFLPGAVYSISNVINKKLYIIGVGHNTDSTYATGVTHIGNNIYIGKNGSGGALIGVHCLQNIYASDTITNYTISRCCIESNIHSNGGVWASSTISENIAKGSILSLFQSKVSNNITFQIGGQYNAVDNNIIYTGVSGTNNIISNNIINAFGNVDPVQSIYTCWSQYYNNIFIGIVGLTFPSSGGNNYCGMSNNLGQDNFSNPAQTLQSTFANPPSSPFNYANDYHLKLGSVGVNAGTDGTDIGIYGGDFPWKDGSIPSNPHVQYQQINGTTNASGNLPVHIKVSAQDH